MTHMTPTQNPSILVRPQKKPMNDIRPPNNVTPGISLGQKNRSPRGGTLFGTGSPLFDRIFFVSKGGRGYIS